MRILRIENATLRVASKNVLLNANISNTHFDQRSPRPAEESVLNLTNGQMDMATICLNRLREADLVIIPHTGNTSALSYMCDSEVTII